jgi:hypothetical protein
MKKRLAAWLRKLADKLDPPVTAKGGGGPGTPEDEG